MQTDKSTLRKFTTTFYFELTAHFYANDPIQSGGCCSRCWRTEWVDKCAIEIKNSFSVRAQ